MKTRTLMLWVFKEHNAQIALDFCRTMALTGLSCSGRILARTDRAIV